MCSSYVLQGFGRPEPPLLTWVQDRRPQVVFEFSSRRSLRKDPGAKLSVFYQRLCVAEYFVFDVAQRKLPRLVDDALREKDEALRALREEVARLRAGEDAGADGQP